MKIRNISVVLLAVLALAGCDDVTSTSTLPSTESSETTTSVGGTSSGGDTTTSVGGTSTSTSVGWTAEQVALMETYFGEGITLPYYEIPGVVVSYYEDYGCVSAESEDASLSEADVVAYEAILESEGFEYINYDYDGETYYTWEKVIDESTNTVFDIDVYYDYDYGYFIIDGYVYAY